MISVIIITYKRSQYIKRAIESVLNQTYQDFELIVVDDNDSGTVYRKELEKIMLEYANDKRVKYIKHEYNKNGAAARNTGITVSKGKYIAFLDDDDYYFPDRLEKLAILLDKNLEYSGIYSSVIITQNNHIMGLVEAKRSGNMKKDLLLDNFSFGTGSNLFFRREAVKNLKGFNESFLRHQDIEFMLRFFNENKLLACNIPLVTKVQDDRKNEADLDKLIEIKRNYFKYFMTDINELDVKEKELFYQINYALILDTAIRSKEYRRFFDLKSEFKKEINFSIKNNCRFLALFLNNYIKIEKIKYLKVRKNVIKQYPDRVEFIKKIENNMIL